MNATRPVLWSGAARPYPSGSTLDQLFDEQAALRPDAPAAVHGQALLTYGELRSRSDLLADRLREAGAGPGDFVGVCGSRSLDALVALLGVLKSGAAYVPLDDGLPPERLRAMAEDTGLRVIVALDTVRRLPRGSWTLLGVSAAPPERPSVPRRSPGDAAGPAYVMFTSGSTGRPKPVVIPHRGVVRLVTSEPALSGPGPQDRVLHSCGLSSDASTIEIWAALVNGACLVLVDQPDLLSPPALEKLLRAESVTVAYLTTSVFHLVARSRPEALSGLRHVSAGGEAMSPDLARAVRTACPDTTLVNFYGPTENSVVSTAYVVREVPEDADRVPIGRPIANSTCLVRRPDGTAAAPGEEGELLVGGDGLALGYLGDPGLTAERFVTGPQAPQASQAPQAPQALKRTLYQTGDLVRVRPDGELEFVGRRDRQIKLRGHRIEIDEVEARLRAQDGVAEAAVLVAERESGEAFLTGFYTPAPGAGRDPADILAALRQWLPDQAVPARLLRLDQLPVQLNGKVDQKRLAALADRHADGAASAGQAPEVAGLQDTLAEVWHTTLAVDPGPRDDFFALGGDSLLASETVSRTLTVLGLDASLGSALVAGLLRDPTLEGWARTVAVARDGDGGHRSPSLATLRKDARLGFTLPPRRGPEPRWRDPEQVLLTGATGFLGTFLLDRLLRTTRARVHLPVRARDAEHAGRRVAAARAKYGLPPLEQVVDPGRVVCLPADLARPRLGLTDGQAAELTGCLDLVLHSAAQVNFLYPYAELRAVNVNGTREVLRLAAPRRVPVHFISTVATLAGFGTAGVRHVTEETPLDHGDHLTLGYAESKWAAEALVLDAGARGLPVSVFRPYEITGEQAGGVCNVETAICSLFKTVAETGVAPDIPLPLDFVPVDHAAAAIAHIATTDPPGRHVYHLTNPRPAAFHDVLRRMRAAGCEIRTLPYRQWVRELVRYVAEHPASATAPFVALCVDRSRGADMSVKEMYFDGTFPRLGRTNVERALAGSGLDCPPVDDALLDRYLAYFFASGYIRRPEPTATPGSPR
ncbi:amino acid adenylation domain-containing protein [Streptomyces aurantiacus]|uniref:Putative Linear gramicidin synthase subunit D n=1 Tax=Streptomyces aurantiacus JA 4570 TaxID=1286094 RepID=S4AR01_9ACTN|nr:amino acid adenylation domain-containing protein [Streptomyces aurantiacus]EPH43897.1 putative Linear gramicidin synthase subunit D [Streptomyces aurantiacus JA 4570]